MAFDPNIDIMDPRLSEASTELETLIRKAYPDASFSRLWLDDPEGMHLRVVAGANDPEDVFNLVCDRLLHFQIEEELPLYLVPLRPVGEVLKQLHSNSSNLRPPQANVRLSVS
jgi:hypothetical protein